MPPIVASVLCPLFISYLFWGEYRRKLPLSSGIWIPFIWFVLIASRPLGVWLNLGVTLDTPDDYLEGSPIDRIFFIVLIALGIILLFRKKISIFSLLAKNPWLFLYIIYCGISVLWSDYPVVSFKRWIKEVGNIIMAIIVVSEIDPLMAISALIRRMMYIHIPLSVVLIKYYSALGRAFTPRGEAMYIGVTYHKNSLGILCTVSLIYLAWSFFLRTKNRDYCPDNNALIYPVFGIMSVWLMHMANSSTALLCAIIGIGFIIATESEFAKYHAKVIGKWVILSIISVLLLDFTFGFSELVIAGLGRNTTLTGRTDLWKQLLEMNQQPILGTGYGSFWLGSRAAYFWEKYWWRPNQAHNGFLETYINLGIVGLFFLVGLIVSSFKKMSSSLLKEYEYNRVRMAFLIVILISNMTEAYMKGLTTLWFIFLLMIVELADKASLSHPQPVSVT